MSSNNEQMSTRRIMKNKYSIKIAVYIINITSEDHALSILSAKLKMIPKNDKKAPVENRQVTSSGIKRLMYSRYLKRSKNRKSIISRNNLFILPRFDFLAFNLFCFKFTLNKQFLEIGYTFITACSQHITATSYRAENA